MTEPKRCAYCGLTMRPRDLIYEINHHMQICGPCLRKKFGVYVHSARGVRHSEFEEYQIIRWSGFWQ